MKLNLSHCSIAAMIEATDFSAIVMRGKITNMASLHRGYAAWKKRAALCKERSLMHHPHMVTVTILNIGEIVMNYKN